MQHSLPRDPHRNDSNHHVMSQVATLASAWVWDDESEDELVTSDTLAQLDALEQAAQRLRSNAQCAPECISNRWLIINPHAGTPDLEDFGTVANRLALKSTLTVTQLAACEACQQELAYRWSIGRPEAR